MADAAAGGMCLGGTEVAGSSGGNDVRLVDRLTGWLISWRLCLTRYDGWVVSVAVWVVVAWSCHSEGTFGGGWCRRSRYLHC